MRLRRGQVVRLKQFQGETLLPEELAESCDDYDCSRRRTVVLRLLPEFRVGAGDDGLCEVPVEQIKELLVFEA